MPVTIPAGGGTFTAVEGETYILSPDTTGNITFTGDASFNVIIDTDQTAGTNSINFGSGTDPSVTYAAGVDASGTNINASGDSLTVNIGDNASTGLMNANGVTGAGGLDLNAGDNVSVNAGIVGPTGGVADVDNVQSFSHI